MQRWLYKIVRPTEWDAIRASEAWIGSKDDVRDGFVHLSAPDQVAGTLAKWFAGEPLLYVLRVDAELLPAGSLKWEPSRGGALFPHVYAPLPRAAIVATAEVRDGRADPAFTSG
jgi:uncharacterized protein (DUF952 family)